MLNEVLDKHIPDHFDTSEAADKIGENILSTNASIAPISAFLQRRISKAVADKPMTTKMGSPLKDQMSNADLKHVMEKSVSLPSRKDSALGFTPSYKNEEDQADRGVPEYRSCPLHHRRRHLQDERGSSTSKRSASSDESPSYFDSDSYLIPNRSQRGRRSKD